MALQFLILLICFSQLACTNATVNVSNLNSVFNFNIELSTSAPSVVSGSFKVYVEFTEPVLNFSASDILITNGSILGSIEGSSQQFSFTLVPTGDVTLEIPAFQVQSQQFKKYNFEPVILNVGYDSSPTAAEVILRKSILSSLEGDSTSSRTIELVLDSVKPYPVEVPYRIENTLTTMPSTRHTLPQTGTVIIPAGSTVGTLNYNFLGDSALNANFDLVVAFEATSSAKVVLKENVFKDSVVDDDSGSADQYLSMSVSEFQICRINLVNELYCWGQNTRGQVGNGTLLPVATPTRIDNLSTYTEVSTSEGEHTCAITTAGDLKCWGYNFNGQLGNGTTTDLLTPGIIDSGTQYKMVSTGENHTCAITTMDELKCWGDNAQGQLGDGTTNERSTPIVVDGGISYLSISAGRFSTCGITSGFALRCWGLNSNSQLGLGDTTNRLSPTVVDPGVSYSSISLGYNHVCGIMQTTLQLKCWGSGTNGKLGNGSLVNRSTPGLVDMAVSFLSVELGFNHTCAVTSTNELKCWGNNNNGQLGDGSLTDRYLPAIVNPGVQYQRINSSNLRTCAITVGNRTQCWGSNTYNLVASEPTRQLTPRLINDSRIYQQISASRESTWGISEGQLFVWGLLMNNSIGPIYTLPKRIQTPEIPAFIAAGSDHQCFISTSKKLFCRGSNAFGQLGIGSISTYETDFLSVDASESYDLVSVGVEHTCAVTESQNVKCWGQNSSGQLGNGTTINSSVPQTVTLGFSISKVATASGTSCALNLTGQVYCWGASPTGQLGNNTTTTSLVPVQVSDLSTFTDIKAGAARFCGTNSDQRIRCWGSRLNGGLGNGVSGDSLIPEFVSGSQLYTKVSAGSFNSCGLTVSSQLYCWGANTTGKIGDGSTTTRNTPVLIDASENYIDHTVNDLHACGLLSSGRVKCWGSTQASATGTGAIRNILNPVFIP